MQIRRLQDQFGAHKRYVNIINRFIKRLRLLRHTRKEFIAAKPRNNLFRRLQNLESLLPKIPDQTQFVSSPFVHTSINGRRVLLHKAVLVSKTSIHRQVSQSKYSTIKIDQMIRQLVHLRNNLDGYLLLMDNRQRSSILRIISDYTKKPSFKKMKAGNYKVGKMESQKNEKTPTLKNTIQSKLSNPTGVKKSIQKEIINDRKPTKTIPKTPKKMTKQGSYNPYAEQELDIYIDSLLEDADLDLGEMEDSILS